jgi:signal transduction histidine kinase
MSRAESAIASPDPRRRRRTLRGRVALVGLGAIACWLAVLAVTFDILFAHQLDDQRSNVARARATAAAATVRFTRTGRPLALESAGDAALDYGIWIYVGSSAVQRPHASAELQRLADSLTRADGRTSATDAEATVVAVPLSRHGRRVATVVASASAAAYQRLEHTAVVGSIALSMLLLVGAYPVFRLAGRRALQPVEQMTHQAREWSAHSPGERFGGGQRFAELHDLATTLDDVLDRLSAVLRHERQLPAELSHELRTPLSTILAEAELLAGRHPSEPGARAIRESALNMNDIIETLLTTARAELQSADDTCDARDVIERLIAARDGRFEIRGDQTTVGVDDAVLTRLLAPIIDNVTRYSRAGVDIEIARRSTQVVIDIANDGPEIPDPDSERIFEPGVSGGSGAGLGLSLARRLARAADGDVVCVPMVGGARFRVTLPHG